MNTLFSLNALQFLHFLESLMGPYVKIVQYLIFIPVVVQIYSKFLANSGAQKISVFFCWDNRKTEKWMVGARIILSISKCLKTTLEKSALKKNRFLQKCLIFVLLLRKYAMMLITNLLFCKPFLRLTVANI